MDTATSATIAAAATDPPRNDHRDRIATALARLRDTVVARPEFGRHTARSRASLGDGVSCISTQDSWQISTDLPSALGGERSAPTPSQLVQAALGACLAMGYQLRAAERGIALTSVTVTVESDAELRALLSPQDLSPGFGALRYHVDIDSTGDPVQIEALIDAADRLSPVLADLTRPIPVERTVTITCHASTEDD